MTDKINLKLNNGTIIEVDVSSTVDNINVTGTLVEIFEAIRAITTESLKNATLYSTPQGETIINRLLVTFHGEKKEDEYFVSFVIREKSENEVINERLDEQDAALMELAELIGG